MATISYTTSSVGTRRILVQWSDIGSDDVAQPYNSGDATLLSVQSVRNGAGTNGILKGSNDPGASPTVGSSILNLFGGIVLEKPAALARWYFPEVFDGEGTLTVTALFETVA